jgi:hypothetical protein
VGVAEGIVGTGETVASALVDGRAVAGTVGLPAAIKLGGFTVGEATELLQLTKNREMRARKLTASFKLDPDRLGRKENITRSPY